MKKTDVAYIAGLIDGEAYIGIKRMNTLARHDCKSPTYHARIQIRMVDEAAIKFITENLGGSYYKEKPAVAKGRPLYCYQASDEKAANILRTVLPYLRVKRTVAKTVLNLRELQANGRKHRTKTTGYRIFPHSKTGQDVRVPNLSFSDEYVEMCDSLYQQCKSLNFVGVR